MTNKDNIQNMTDEQLAEFLHNTNNSKGIKLGNVTICNDSINIVAWLKSEVEK